jgi:hypothetical protein
MPEEGASPTISEFSDDLHACDLGVGVVAVRSTLCRADGKLRLGEPRTARSRRSVRLTAEPAAALRRHRERQAAERLTATLLLGRGVHPKIVSEILGHATVAITLDT